MNFLLSENIIIQSPLHKDELIKNLQNNIEPRKPLRFIIEAGSKKFEGQVQENEFDINRLSFVNLRNPQFFIIHGTIEDKSTSTTITINFGIHQLVLLIIKIVCTVIILQSLFSLIALMVTKDSIYANRILISLGALVFGYILIQASFLYETGKSKALLLAITVGQIKNNV